MSLFAETEATTANVIEDLTKLISGSAEYQEAAQRQAELLGKLTKLEGEQAKLAEKGSDLERTAQKLAEGGRVDFRKDHQRQAVLSEEIEAHRLAVSQAEANRREVLRKLSQEGCAMLAPVHRERVQELVDCYRKLDGLWRNFDELPRLLKRQGLTPNNAFPMNGSTQWQQFSSHQLLPAIQALESWLEQD